jgi:hypothetical protein
VTLLPLGWQSPAGWSFVFDNVPDGDYVLTVAPEYCNPYGCWVDTHVTVAGADVTANICMVDLVTPTSTPTSTRTPDPAAVGGVAEPPVSNDGASNVDASLAVDLLLAVAVAGAGLLAACGWYAKGRLGRQRR